MERWKRTLISLLVLTTVLLPSFSCALPHVGEDDDYIKDGHIGKDVEFVWTLSRDINMDHAVRVIVETDVDWEYSISESHFVLDGSNPYQIVKVTFTVPRTPEDDSLNALVTFRFRELDTQETQEESVPVRIDVTGVIPAPESNTIVGGFPNPLPRPFNNPYGAFGLNLLIWFLVGYIFYFLVSPIIHSFTKKTKTNIDEIIVRLIRKPVLMIIFLYGLLESLMRLNLRLGIRTTIYQIYLVTVVLIATFITYKIMMAILHDITMEKGGRHSSFGTVLKPVLEKVFGGVVLVGGLILVFHVLGVQVTALLAGAGIAGLVIAFAAQDTLANFFSGMHLLLDRPFKIGDIIKLETGEFCRIEDIGLRSTKLYNIRDHEGIVMPNNNIASQKIVNIVQPDATIRVPIEIGVAYGSDVEKVKSILYEVAEAHPNVLNDDTHKTNVRFRDFADSSLNFSLRVWVDEVVKQWAVMSDLRETIDKRFREENIEIPFPQRTVWLHQQND